MKKSISTEGHRRLARLLHELRLKAGLTQTEVAARLDVHQSFVSKYESGERRLDLPELSQVCDALGVDVVSAVRAWAQRES